MKENLLDVLIYMFEFCEEDVLKLGRSDEILHGKLVRAGFDNEEIFKAFSWLNDLSEAAQIKGEQTTESGFRVFSRFELGHLPKTCIGLLIQLEQLGMIGPESREQIIERALALEIEDMDLDQFKWVIMMVLLNRDEDVPAFIWDDGEWPEGGSGRVH